jgi:CRP-like cAMP-binding protein
MKFNPNADQSNRFQLQDSRGANNLNSSDDRKKYPKNAVHPRKSLPFSRKDAMRIATSRVGKNKARPLEMRDDEDEGDDISSSSVEEKEEKRVSVIRSKVVTSKKSLFVNKLRLLKHTVVFVFRLTKRLEHRKIYGIPRHTLNPHFKPLELIRRNINSLHGSSGGVRHLHSTLNIISDRKVTRWLFYPNQTGMILWSIISICIITFLMVYVPASLAFDYSNIVMKILDDFIDIFFIADFLLNFNLAVQLPDGSYETSRKQIALRYIKGYFFIDLITSFPFGWVLDQEMQVTVQYNKALRILKLPKMISTIKLTRKLNISSIFVALKLGDMWRYRIKSKEGLFKIIFLALLVLVAIHLGSCVWIIIGSIESFAPNTWIIDQHFVAISDSELYITAFYYCLVVFMTVGYGDVTSTNSLERSFSILWMMFGIAFYSFTISFITEHFTNIETPKSLLNKKLKQLKAFAVNKMMPFALVQAVQKNLEYAATMISYRWVDGQRNLLTDLSLELKYYFYRDLHREVLRSPFFDSNNDAFAVRILERLKPVRMKRNQFFWSKHDIPSNIVFIVEGKMFYMIDNVYYRKNEKGKKIDRHANESNDENEMVKRKSTFHQSTSNSINTKMGRSFSQKVAKVVNLFGLKDIKRTFGNLNSNAAEFKNGAQIKRHLMTDSSNTMDVRDLPLVAFRIWSPGSYLGEEEIIWPSPRKYYLKAATDVQLMLLPRADFEMIVKQEFSEIYQKLVHHGEVRRGFLEDIKKKVIKDISVFFRSNNASQYKKDTRTIIEKSFYQIRKEREIHEIPTLDNIIRRTREDNSFEDMFKTGMDCESTEEDHRLEKLYARERAKSPGLMKMYTNWRSKLTRVTEGTPRQGRTQPGGRNPRCLGDHEHLQVLRPDSSRWRGTNHL